ncbi:MAG: hypothetical protein ICV73_05670 [Acetobacteraceae bacterium]|nr:hypothetical protein [Acetobacteraceae bacterium]
MIPPSAVLPEVREADAPPDVAAIYAGLRGAVGVPIVNLIWRHFATLPGVLPWAWEAARGAIASATVAEGRARQAEIVRAAPGLDLSAVGSALLGLPAMERARVAQVVRVYNRGNGTNLQVLSAVRRLIAAGVTVGWARPVPGGAPPAAPIAGSIPALPRMEDLPEAVRGEVSALAALHDPPDPVVPSLYRHLALWPDLLPPLRGALAPRFSDGRIASLRASLLNAAEESAAALLPCLTPPGPFPAEHRDAVLRVLAAFPGKLIAEMAAVGLALDAELTRAGAA